MTDKTWQIKIQNDLQLTVPADINNDAIYAYIALDSPEYAKHIVDRLTSRSVQIA